MSGDFGTMATVMDASPMATDGGGGPLQVTITGGNACPWGFNPANRGPTALEQQQHDVCQLVNASNTFGDFLSNALKVFIDDIRVWAADLWAMVKSIGGAVLGPVFNDLAAAVENAWQWMGQELGALAPWLIVGGLAAYALLSK